MDYNTILDHAEKVLPVVATLVVARYANQNSPKWTEWTGKAGRLVGLAISLLDVFRSPKAIAKDIKPVKKRRKK